MTVKSQLENKIIVPGGDVSGLSKTDILKYYNLVCDKFGLNINSDPIKLATLNSKKVLFFTNQGVEDLINIYDVEHEVLQTKTFNHCSISTVRAKTKDGRFTDSVGAESLSKIQSELKSVEKAKYRATLDLLGIGIIHESDIIQSMWEVTSIH